MGSQDTVSVEIGDRTYTLKAGENPEYVRQVAGYVDQQMKDLASYAPSLQQTHLAVLTAVNLADELLQSKGGAVSRETLAEVQRRLKGLIDKIPA